MMFLKKITDPNFESEIERYNQSSIRYYKWFFMKFAF